jgi:hypothetical protein
VFVLPHEEKTPEETRMTNTTAIIITPNPKPLQPPHPAQPAAALDPELVETDLLTPEVGTLKGNADILFPEEPPSPVDGFLLVVLLGVFPPELLLELLLVEPPLRLLLSEPPLLPPLLLLLDDDPPLLLLEEPPLLLLISYLLSSREPLSLL